MKDLRQEESSTCAAELVSDLPVVLHVQTFDLIGVISFDPGTGSIVVSGEVIAWSLNRLCIALGFQRCTLPDNPKKDIFTWGGINT